jgi:hypothetical protein
VLYCVQRFDGLRRHWLAAINALGRNETRVVAWRIEIDTAASPRRRKATALSPLLLAVLTDTKNKGVVGVGNDSRRAGTYSSIVASFLHC